VKAFDARVVECHVRRQGHPPAMRACVPQMRICLLRART
jgi:hypothetical protein